MKLLMAVLGGVMKGFFIFMIIAILIFMAIQGLRPAHADDPQYNYRYSTHEGELSDAMMDMLVINLGDNERFTEVSIKMYPHVEDRCFESNALLKALQNLVDSKIEEDPSRAHYYVTATESINRAWCVQ